MCNLRYTIYDIRSTILKSIVLILFLISYSTVKAQDSSSLKRLDSIFNKPYVSKDSVIIKDTTKRRFLKAEKQDTIISKIEQNDSIITSSSNKKIKKQKKIDTAYYSPKKAAILAAACPGLGQIYMKKYWKLPIVYGLMGGVLYFVISNGQNLRKYNGYISNVYDSVPNPSPIDNLTLSQIETYRNTYRKNVQIASFGTVIVWGLSIVDAVVDAHLHSFDMSDKLAIKVKPQLNYSNFTYYAGIGVNLTFK